MAAAGALAAALTREHHDIDAGFEAFLADLEGPGTAPPDTAPLTKAVTALRRHIYLEEAFLFPAMKGAGLFAALLVMHREHGEIWRSMERLVALTEALGGEAGGAGRAGVLAECRALLAIVDKHNAKEEPIIYARADADLAGEAAERLAEFMRGGSTPPGWVCRAAGA